MAATGQDHVNPFGDNHQVTRKSMQAVLAGGGSIVWHGEIITDPTKLPSEADLERARAKPELSPDDIKRQMDLLRAQYEELVGKLTASSPTLPPAVAPLPPLVPANTNADEQALIAGEPAAQQDAQAEGKP